MECRLINERLTLYRKDTIRTCDATHKVFFSANGTPRDNRNVLDKVPGSHRLRHGHSLPHVCNFALFILFALYERITQHCCFVSLGDIDGEVQHLTLYYVTNNKWSMYTFSPHLQLQDVDFRSKYQAYSLLPRLSNLFVITKLNTIIMTIGIFPASGALGTSTYTHLLNLVPNDEVVLVNRHPKKVPQEYVDTGVKTRQASYESSPSELEAAFAGVDVLFLISYPSHVHEYRVKVSAPHHKQFTLPKKATYAQPRSNSPPSTQPAAPEYGTSSTAPSASAGICKTTP